MFNRTLLLSPNLCHPTLPEHEILRLTRRELAAILLARPADTITWADQQLARSYLYYISLIGVAKMKELHENRTV
jgi:hypothetical protein